MKDRIEITYEAVDQMIKCHGNERHERFGGGKWNAEEEFKIYKEQVGDRYTELQWKIISTYFYFQFKEATKEVENGN